MQNIPKMDHCTFNSLYIHCICLEIVLRIWKYEAILPARSMISDHFFKLILRDILKKTVFYYIKFSDLMTLLPSCCQSREKWVLFSLDITRKHHGDSFGWCQNRQLFLTRCFPQAKRFFNVYSFDRHLFFLDWLQNRIMKSIHQFLGISVHVYCVLYQM